jgi:hypothetical protein
VLSEDSVHGLYHDARSGVVIDVEGGVGLNRDRADLQREEGLPAAKSRQGVTKSGWQFNIVSVPNDRDVMPKAPENDRVAAACELWTASFTEPRNNGAWWRFVATPCNHEQVTRLQTLVSENVELRQPRWPTQGGRFTAAEVGQSVGGVVATNGSPFDGHAEGDGFVLVYITSKDEILEIRFGKQQRVIAKRVVSRPKAAR